MNRRIYMRKGFTLIELLAVIVILAVIATIATPIVLNIINDAKESSVRNSAEFYIDAVESAIMDKNMSSDGDFNPSVCIVNVDGNVVCDGITLEVRVSGKKPNGGTFLFEDTTLVNVSLVFDNISLILNDGELVTHKEIKICEAATDSTKTTGNIPNGKFEFGDEYICEVSGGVKYNFFVLGTDNNKVTLILDRNINSDGTLATVAADETTSAEGKYSLMPWISSFDYDKANTDNTACEYDSCIDEGPITAINFLNNAVATWTNIPNINEDYEDENIDYNTLKKGNKGYGNIKLTGRARMPKYSELYGENKCLTATENSEGGSCPLWLVNYLDNYAGVTGEGHVNIANMSGYWILSSNAT